MRRARKRADSSLELLLDTICNTFGGVLFLAILVIILLQMTGNPQAADSTDRATEAEVLQMQQQLAEARAEVARLQLVAVEHNEMLHRLARPDQREAIERLKDLRRQSEELLARRQAATDEIREQQAETDRLTAEQGRLETETAAADKELAAVEAARKLEVASRTQTAKLPRVRISTKDEVALMLRGGRLYLMATRGPLGQLELNQAECIEQRSANGTEIMPKPGAGSEIRLDGGSRAAIAQRLGTFAADDCYLAVFVWADSFAQFREVKHAMVASGFEYKLVPLPLDGHVYVGAGRERAAEVQ